MKLLEAAIQAKRWDLAAYCLLIGLCKAWEADQDLHVQLKRAIQSQDTQAAKQALHKAVLRRAP